MTQGLFFIILYAPMTQEERKDLLLNGPVNRVLPRLAIPTVVSMLITALYNLADTFFVGQISTDATAASGAVGVILPVMVMAQAIAFTIGQGSGNFVSRHLGSGEKDRAKQYLNVGLFTGFAFGILYMIFGLVFLDRLVDLLGSTKTIAPHAKSYGIYILIGEPFIISSFIMNNQMRYQGLAKLSMIGILTGGILNIILDPVFIFALKLGISGAGLSTCVSQVISFFILIYMCQKKEETISISIKCFKPSFKIYKDIFYTGMPSFFRQGSISAAAVVLNNAAVPFGDAVIAAMSIVAKYSMFCFSLILGFCQGFQPFCGFNYGARKYDRIREGFWFCVKVTTVCLVVTAAASMIISGRIISFFRDDAEVVKIGTAALRFNLLSIPTWGFYLMCSILSQVLGYGIRSTFISSARQGIFLIPCLLIFSSLLGIRGIQIAQPVTDLVAFVFSWLMIRKVLCNFK